MNNIVKALVVKGKMSRFFITGDTHIPVDIEKIKLLNGLNLTRDDYLIVCGDFGLIWNWDTTGKGQDGRSSDLEMKWRKTLSELPYTILFVDGNHENFDRLDAMPESEWRGGKVHIIEENVIHLMRGQVFDIGGKILFAFGGARSHDRGEITGTEDLDEGIIWWRREMPSNAEKLEGLDNLKKIGNAVDYIITHSGPTKMTAAMGYMRDALSDYFDMIEETVQFQDWYCGHYHTERSVDNVHTLYNGIIELRP